MQPDDDLLRLAAFHGVEAEYLDAAGQRQAASAEVLRGVLDGLGVATGDTRRALRAAQQRRWSELLDPVALAWAGRGSLLVRVPAGARGRAHVELQAEDGATTAFACELSGAALGGAADVGRERYVERRLALPGGLRRGYYGVRVRVRAGGVERRGEGTLIVAPRRTFGGAPARREFGVFAPLYAVRSTSSVGGGDLGDLRRLLQWTLARGGSAVGTLPLLAAYLDAPAEVSPYLPVSRLAWNELYLELAAIPEWASSAAAHATLASEPARAERARLARAPFADPVAAMALKHPALAALARALFAQGGARRGALDRFAAARPEVVAYARFRAACARLGRPWQRWPAAARAGRLRDADTDGEAYRYHLYVQWCLHEQLTALRRAASQRAGRGAIGPYLDLPLGVHGAGFDTWREGALFASALGSGAPPDRLFTEGQHWGFPPLHPQRERERGHAYTRAALHNHMRYAGALRVDHVMGLHRRYVIPPGATAREGTYVRYAAAEHWAMLTLESQRARTLVVGEDLGTVPPEVHAALRRHGALGMHVLQYAPSDTARAGTLAALNTHDMAPFAGWLRGRDIDWRARLGTFDAEAAARERAERRRAVAALRATTPARGAGRGRVALLHTSLQRLAGSPARLVVVALDDLLGAVEAQNLPGTVEEHPNWRRKLRLPLEQIERSEAVAAGIALVAAARGTAGADEPDGAGRARYSAT